MCACVCVYKVCVKNNGTGVLGIIYFYVKLHVFPFKAISLEFHFSILFHAFMRWSKDSFWMILCSMVTTFLMIPTASKWIPS